MSSATSIPLRISGIRIGNLGAEGRYRRPDRSIVLDGDVDSETLQRNARHEICHALDFQGGLHTADDSAWTYTSPTLLDSYGEKTGRREAFADVCSRGPLAWSRVGTCTEEAAHLTGYHEALFDLQPAPLPMDFLEDFSLNVGVNGELMKVRANADGTVTVELRDQDGVAAYSSYDVEQGQEVPLSGANAIPPTTSDLLLDTPWQIVEAIETVTGTVGVARWNTVTAASYTVAFHENLTGELSSSCVEEARVVVVDDAPWVVEKTGGSLRFRKVRVD